MLSILSIIGAAYAGIIVFIIALGKAAQRGDAMREEAFAMEEAYTSFTQQPLMQVEKHEQGVPHADTFTARRLEVVKK